MKRVGGKAFKGEVICPVDRLCTLVRLFDFLGLLCTCNFDLDYMYVCMCVYFYCYIVLDCETVNYQHKPTYIKKII